MRNERKEVLPLTPNESPSFSDAAFLRDLLDRIPAAVFGKAVDDEFRIVYWNRFAEEYWGLKRADVLGRVDSELFPAEQASFFRKKDLETIVSNRPVTIEEEEIRVPKGNLILRTSKICVTDRSTGKRFLVGLAEDITEEKRLRDALAVERMNAMNAAKMGALGEMAASIAHEINTPLSVLTLTIERIRRTFGGPEAGIGALHEGLDSLLKTASRIAKVVRALRVYSRHSEQDPPETVSVSSLVQDAIALCEKRARAEGVQLAVSRDAEASVSVRPTQIVQALLNLVGNSIDALAGRADARIVVSLEASDEEVRIQVADNGPGIPPEIAARIMEPFFTTKPPGKGTGLGLSIAKQLMEANGGALELDPSAPGACFVGRLPRTKL